MQLAFMLFVHFSIPEEGTMQCLSILIGFAMGGLVAFCVLGVCLLIKTDGGLTLPEDEELLP